MILDLQELTRIATNAALEAGKVIEKHLNSDVIIKKKDAGNTYASQVFTAVDLACEKTILSYLLPTCKKLNIGLLTEEREDDKSRFEKEYFWCIDPMDGTLAFINKHPGFSVAIALVSRDGIPQIGVVYDPSSDNIYTAVKDKGALKNGKPWKLNSSKNYLTYVTDRKLADTQKKEEILKIINTTIDELQLEYFKEISGSGSGSVINAILVAENTPALLIKLPKKEKGGGSIWDFAATACIFNELGLKSTNFEGGALDLNRKESSFMNHQGVFYSNL